MQEKLMNEADQLWISKRTKRSHIEAMKSHPNSRRKVSTTEETKNEHPPLTVAPIFGRGSGVVAIVVDPCLEGSRGKKTGSSDFL